MTAETATRASPPTGPYSVRLAGAMAVSLLVHTLIISLQFGVPGVGLPALELPWHERRAQAIDLNVVLANPAGGPAAPEASAALPPPPPAPAATPPAGLRLVPMPETAASPPAGKSKTKRAKARAKDRPLAAARPPRARAKRETPVIALNEPRDNSFNMPAPALDEISPAPEPETAAPPPVAVPEPAETAPADDPAEQERELIAQKLAEEETARQVREAEERAARLQEEAKAQREIEAARRQEEELKEKARQHALALDAERAEDAKRREQAERLALELEERRKAEAAANRQAAALALQKQQEEVLQREREEAARRALELEEKQRAETLRLQAEQQQRAQREAMEIQARKHAEAEATAAAEAARQQAAARERERLAEELAAHRKAEAEAASTAKRERERERDPELVLGDNPGPGARIDALPRNLTGGGLAGRALEQARRGDMLQGDPARTVPAAARQPDGGMDMPRRRSIFGSKDVDVGLMMYVESWRLKIERNGSINYPRASVDKAQGDPVVTVAIRSDGSVEDVIIHRSSGRPELDDAVRRIVRVNARYSVFPPELARRFDVIEIRRVWNFDDRLRILEEVR